MNLVLTGGGTAGHCLPHIAVLPYLETHFKKVDYVGSEKGMERGIAEGAGLPYHSVTAVRFERRLTPKNLLIPLRLAKGYRESRRLLRELRPDAVFSKGGYVALPVVLAAHSLGIPVVAHESDLTAGLANRISARYADRMLTSFPETAAALPNAVCTGAPVREEVLRGDRDAARRKYGFSGRLPVLLVVGGSSGAESLNRAVRGILPELLRDFRVLHLTGKNRVDPLARLPGYVQVGYEPDMASAYAAADLAVSRAGAGAAFELLAAKIPALFVPLPRAASRGDQILNAEYFQRRGLALMLPAERAEGEEFASAIRRLFDERLNLKNALERSPVLPGNANIGREIVRAATRNR